MFAQYLVQSFPWKQAKDRVLKRELRELLLNDKRAQGIDVSLNVRGGVAQIEGNVTSIHELQIIRDLFARHESIYAVWDVVEINGKKPQIADIGCGNKKQVTEAIGIDKIKCDGVDVIADLEQELPLKNNSFDSIFAVHVIEHIHNLIRLMNELHRVLRPTGILHIMTPNWKYPTAVADPTHVRFMDKQTILYFCQGKQGVLCWKPQSIKVSEDTVFADLLPVKEKDEQLNNEYLARWFH